MNIRIKLSKDELKEIELDKIDLHTYIIETLDDKGDICLPAYDVFIEIDD